MRHMQRYDQMLTLNSQIVCVSVRKAQHKPSMLGDALVLEVLNGAGLRGSWWSLFQGLRSRWAFKIGRRGPRKGSKRGEKGCSLPMWL